jgi:hypothetical protein
LLLWWQGDIFIVVQHKSEKAVRKTWLSGGSFRVARHPGVNNGIGVTSTQKHVSFFGIIAMASSFIEMSSAKEAIRSCVGRA